MRNHFRSTGKEFSRVDVSEWVQHCDATLPVGVTARECYYPLTSQTGPYMTPRCAARSLFAVALATLASGWTACGGNMANSVCAPEQLVGKPPSAVTACYGEPDKVARCTRPGCADPSEERWFYGEVWSTSSEGKPPFACLVVIDGKVTQFITDSVICALGSPDQGTP